jgi:transcriptional regulator with XRE-family HTH domain
LARKRRESPPALASRIEGLILESHQGIVSRAAADIGIPQPTLARLAAGKVKNPRLDALQALTAYYGVSADWLLEGRGEGPRARVGPGGITPEWKEWEALLRGLEPSQEAFEAALFLPFAAYRAWFLLTRDDTVSPPKNRVRMGLRDLVREISVWTASFRAIIDEFGRDHLRAALERHVDDARLGFCGFALDLHENGDLPADLTIRYKAFVPHFWEFQEGAGDAGSRATGGTDGSS